IVRGLETARRHFFCDPGEAKVRLVSERGRKMRISRRRSLSALAALGAAGAGLSIGTTQAAQGTKPIRLVVLDIGGTIIEDHGEVPNAMSNAFKKGGVEVSLAEIGEWRGASKKGMVRHFVEVRTAGANRDALTESIYKDFSAQASYAYRNVKAINGAEVAAVGDTPLDLQAASNAGVRGVIGVYSGAATKERLEREPHTHILASIA